MKDLEVTWAKESGYWRIRLYVKSSRLDKHKIELRIDKNGINWAGWNQKDISTKSFLDLEKKYNDFRSTPIKNLNNSTKSTPTHKTHKLI